MASSNDPITKLALQLVPFLDPSSTGGAWSTQAGKNSPSGFGPEGMMRQIAQRFIDATGVSDINDLELRTATKPIGVTVNTDHLSRFYVREGDTSRYLTDEEIKTMRFSDYVSEDPIPWAPPWSMLYAEVTLPTKGIYNKKTGQLIADQKTYSWIPNDLALQIDLGGWGEGPGMTYASISFDKSGKPKIYTSGKDSNSIGDIIPILSIALMAIPGVGQAVGAALLPTGVSTAVATAVGNAVVNAGLQVASGVPVEKAILNSAASLGVSQLVPNLSGNVYVDNAVKSVATAALTGGDVGNALANSLIATGGNELLGNTSFTGDKVVDSAIASAITSGVQAAATDGDVGASAIKGALAGASGQLTKEEKIAESAKSGSGFIGEDVTEPTSVAEPGIDPRILAQGVTGGQFGEGGFLQTGAQVPVDVLQDLMKLRPDLVSMNDSGNYSLKVPTSDGVYTAYEISPSGQVLNAQPGLSVGETLDPSKTASALEAGIKIEEGKSSEQAVPEGSGLSGSVQPKATDLSPAAQETLLQIGGVLGLGEQDPDAVYEALIGGASGGIGDVALLGYDQLAKLQDEIELIFDEPNLPANAKSEMAKIYAEVTNQKRIQEEAIRDQLLNDQQPTEQQVADTGLTVVDQPVVDQPVVTAPSVTQPEVTAPIDTGPVVSTPIDTGPVVTTPEISVPPVVVPQSPSITTPGNAIYNTASTAPAALQAEIDKIMRMAVKKEAADLRYDVNKDGRVNVFDAVLVSKGQATIPTAEEYGAQQSASSSTVPSTTPSVTQPVEQTPSVEPPSPPPIVEPTPPTSEVTGIVLQNNGDGTALVLTNDGNATNVPVTDAVSNEPLTPGASVTVDQNTNTATVTPPASDVEKPVVQEPPSPTPPTPAVPTTPEEPITKPPQEPVVSVPPTEPPVTEPVVTKPVVTEPVVTEPVVTEPPIAQPVITQPVVTTPPVLTPEQIAAQELDAEILKILRMAVKKDPVDMRYDLNKDGRVNVIDALALQRGQATVPTVEEYQASLAQQTVAPQPEIAEPSITQPAVTEPVTQEPLTQDIVTTAPSTTPTVQDTGDQQILGGGQQPTTDAGSIIDTPIGTDTSTPAVTPGLDVNVNPNVNVDEPIPPVDELPPVDEFLPVEDRLPPLPPPVKTEEDLLLEQIIRELEPTPPVSEGVPIQEPEFPEPPLVLPESPTINVADRLTVRPVVDRGYRRPSVSPGSRVEESAQILPIRPGLSEGGTGGIEGTTEQEQEPVWNVRSLKLRRLLGI